MRRLTPEILIAGLLFFVPLVLFWPQTVGGQTLLPTENLYKFEPYASMADVGIPQNHLLDDLILQNYQWKSFIKDNIAAGEIPLWNPHQFAGQPFMAAGQQSTLYPLSVLYYGLPLPAAYGWFTVVALWLAGWFMYGFLRGLGLARIGGVVGGMTYQLSGFLVVSAVHPMIIGAAVWLPVMLLMAEFIIRGQTVLKRPATPLWVIIGAAALAFNVFSGHPEITIYSLLITGFYAALRLAALMRQTPLTALALKGGWLLVMVGLGFGLSAIQFIPLFEVANSNWRTERGSLAEVLSFAHPVRDFLLYLMPNFYGNPAHQHVFDWFAMERVPVEFVNALGETRYHTEWGIKNYVEGALYVGILPLILAAFALWDSFLQRRNPTEDKQPPYRVIFLLLTIISLTFTFGMPTYAAVYVLPGINQLNTAFRWVYGVTAGIAVLAGFGAHALLQLEHNAQLRKAARRFGLGVLAVGALILIGLGVSRLFYDSIAPLVARVFSGMAQADWGFADARMFYNYQFTNALIFGGMLLGTGAIFLLALRTNKRVWQLGAVVLLAADLIIAWSGFNPASDPALLDDVPPSIAWLQAQDGTARYITLEDPATFLDKTLQANMTLQFGLYDVRGYESIISADTKAYMETVQVQPQLNFNRIAPLYLDRVQSGGVNWEALAALNLGYIVAQNGVAVPEDWERLYNDDVVSIYAPPIAPYGAAFVTSTDPGASVEAVTAFDPITSRERLVDITLSDDTTRWLVLSEMYAPGWRAFIRPVGVNAFGEVAEERELTAEQVAVNLIGVALDGADLPALWGDADLSDSQQQALMDGRYVVRFIYSPTSFQIGAFGTAISAALAVFLLGVWLWGLLVGRSTADSSGVSVVARNSIAPIVLNLFNRGIDFAFAFVMLRILGPEDAGVYYYAIVVFVWFDIFTNFGLDVFLMREISRDQDRAPFYLLNSSYLRFFLFFACIPVLIGFLAIRQATIDPALTNEALLAIGLLYMGLAPASISKGLTSIFYAYQRAEYPAAVTTITTINKAVFGVIALLLGYGIVGLAGVSIGINLITLGILGVVAWGMIRQSTKPALKPDRPLIGGMVRESWPLMLNHFLATIFFQIDIIILEALRGARIVGQYSVAYRWMLALNVIPAFFTQALLPVMSRQATDDRAALKRTYTLGIKLLVALSVPLAVAFTFMAEGLTLFLGGQAFLPNGAIALQIMIWSIPIGWMNSLTQYALIAVDLQRMITRAFFFAVAFNIITNVIFIPQFGFQAAAVTTILSEAVLLIPFGVLMQRALGAIPWLDLVWRPVVAGVVMLAVTAGLWGVMPLLALMVASVVYGGVLLALRPLNAAERAMLAPALPGRLRGLVSASSVL